MLFLTMHMVHVLTVILWIGGLAFVTGIVLPMAIKTPDPLQKVLTFQRIEHRFAPLAKAYNIIVGITGFVMVWQTGWYELYFRPGGWALTFMTAVWVFWFVMLVGLEPTVIRKMLDRMAREGATMDIDGIFRKVKTLHWVMVAISLAASAAGVLVAHG
ncbi:MAG: hypothetical protein HS130_09325 [Deltaproteobacteria bacterium]|nr:hypothetical protein [Deltaproteobacteria bacterium]